MDILKKYDKIESILYEAEKAVLAGEFTEIEYKTILKNCLDDLKILRKKRIEEKK